MNFFLCLIVVGGIAALIVLRLWLVLCFRKKGQHSVSVRVLVVAGSGGHTTEILRLLGSLSKGYNPRHYVLADTDKMSAVKIRLFEEKRAELDSESLVLCNGPGTCVPICASALLLGILGIKKVIIVYVESICRVETLSLSGKILYHFSDYFFVQWPALKGKYPKSVYLGRIV
ncbi:UDP-N-acetylglucosamine transferase subunit ALG14 homolog isoform X2 [Antechinus flavipes]|uniref:UDP-N-acetylglucosamine transferase subunit ALG14 homolog isoform X2 n=1 Tax=Antechinus flavipes TaxID=38775 RepID=UPI00223566A6|nr:UDP-N-acetylglucosamine transferase subunit ALG14 homolog isoform X2 [Antechinus flavipes]